MWVARVLGRSDEYMRRRTSLSCKAVNSKKLLPALVQKQVAFAMLLVAVHFIRIMRVRASVGIGMEVRRDTGAAPAQTLAKLFTPLVTDCRRPICGKRRAFCMGASCRPGGLP